MDSDEVDIYKEQLLQINQALQNCEENQREELLILKNNIEELLALTNGPKNQNELCSNEADEMSKEYALFMAELSNEGAFTQNAEKSVVESLENLEGKKCRAPHKHQFGNTAYHNAMICSAFEDEDGIKVRVLFTNPTHKEMLPCPYYYESDCKFSDEKCHFSHGEVVLYSCLQEYVEPKFDQLNVGSFVLAKQENNLWHRAVVQKVYDNKCLIKFECNKKIDEVLLEHVFPLDNSEEETDRNSDTDDESFDTEDIINMSLMVTPSSEAMGDWEKHTKGIGSKLMTKMGYIIGTGLGKHAEGRIDPVTAVILPAGKSLDHCMKLREQAGGDKNLFSVERKLKRLQKKQQKQNERAYEQQCKQKDVFDFINNTLRKTKNDVSITDRRALKEESHKNLNIQDFKITENMKKIEDNLIILRNSLNRHGDKSSKTHQHILDKIRAHENQYQTYQKQAQMIRNEVNLRNDRKKLTEF